MQLRRMGLALLLCLAAAALAPALAPALGQAPPPHWQPADAHRLRVGQQLGWTRLLSVRDRMELTRLLLAEIQPFVADNNYSSRQEVVDAVRRTRVKLVDLNGDGTPEILLQAYDIHLCGATGNCEFWVYSRGPHSFRKLLDSRGPDGVGGIQLIQILPGKDGGYHDVLTAAHDSADELGLTVWRFHNGSYVDAGCFYADNKYTEMGVVQTVVTRCPPSKH